MSLLPDLGLSKFSMSGGENVDRPWYRVNGFYPPAPDDRMGGWGFGIVLDVRFARACYGMKRPEGCALNDSADKLISKHMWTELSPIAGFSEKMYDFYDDTCLIRQVRTVGDACALLVDWTDSNVLDSKNAIPERGLIYSPHNVDSVRQAAALLSGWLMWFNAMEATLPRLGETKKEAE